MANEVTLLTALKTGNETVDQVIKNTIIQRSSILQLLPVRQVPNGLTFREMEEVENALGSVSFRSLNEDYTASTGNMREVTYGLKQLGSKIRIDKKMEDSYPGTLANQVQMRLKALGLKVDDAFINGNAGTNPEEFDGLLKLVGTMPSSKTLNGSSLTIDTDASTFRAFLGWLDKAMSEINGNANALFMNDTIYNAVQSGARALGANYLGTAVDFLGQQVISYQGVPFYRLRNNEQGNPILPMTETSSTTSIYMCKLDEVDGVSGLVTGPVELLPNDEGLFTETTINFVMGLRAVSNSLVRIRNLKAA